MTAPRFDRSQAAAGPVVRGFSAGGFSVEGETCPAWLLTPQRASRWRPPPIAELTVDALEPVLSLEPAPEFLILGTGPGQVFPPRRLVEALGQRGIGVEAMDSRAAARTWNVLRAEDRWIAAAIMPL